MHAPRTRRAAQQSARIVTDSEAQTSQVIPTAEPAAGSTLSKDPAWLLPHPLDQAVHRTQLDPWSEDSCRDYIVTVCSERLHRLPLTTLSTFFEATLGTAPTPGSAQLHHGSSNRPLRGGAVLEDNAAKIERSTEDPPSVNRTLVMDQDESNPSHTVPGAAVSCESPLKVREAGSRTLLTDDPSSDELMAKQHLEVAARTFEDVVARNLVLDRFAVRLLQFCYLLLTYQPKGNLPGHAEDGATPVRPSLPLVARSPAVGMRRDAVLIALRNLYFDLLRTTPPVSVETAPRQKSDSDGVKESKDEPRSKTRRQAAAAAASQFEEAPILPPVEPLARRPPRSEAAKVRAEKCERREQEQQQQVESKAVPTAKAFWRDFLLASSSNEATPLRVGLLLEIGKSKALDELAYRVHTEHQLQASIEVYRAFNSH